MPKGRILYILGVVLVFAGAVVHSHAQDWALHKVKVQPSVTMGTLDDTMQTLLEDSGLGMMGLGSIAFTLGLAAWLYPPRTN